MRKVLKFLQMLIVNYWLKLKRNYCVAASSLDDS
jgi:hypothetical protein